MSCGWRHTPETRANPRSSRVSSARWKGWQEIFATLPIAVFDRPAYSLRALSSRAARRFAGRRVREQQADRLPTVAAGAGQTANRAPGGSITRQYTATLGVSAWELDLFGRVKSLNDAALQQYLGK